MWPFKKKIKQEIKLEEFFETQNKLISEGWKYWCSTPPFDIEAVYVRRTQEEDIKILYVKDIPEWFNVVDLWWLPHYIENSLN